MATELKPQGCAHLPVDIPGGRETKTCGTSRGWRPELSSEKPLGSEKLEKTKKSPKKGLEFTWIKY